jgi:hypothetical protein
VYTRINTLIGGASTAFDTLLELQNALGSDANFSTTVLNRISTSDTSVNSVTNNLATNYYTKTQSDATIAIRDTSINSLTTSMTTITTTNGIQDASINSITTNLDNNYYTKSVIDASLTGIVSANGNVDISPVTAFNLTAPISYVNGNLDIGTGANLVAINKDISADFHLDISGNVRASNTAFTNNILPLISGDTLNIASTQQTGVLNIGTLTARTGAINIGTGTSNKNLTIGSTSAGTTALRGSTVFVTGTTVLLGNSVTTGTVAIGNTMTTGTLLLGNAMTGGTINIGPVGATASTTTMNVATGSAFNGTLKIMDGSGIGVATIGKNNAIRIVNGASTTVDISATGLLTLRGSKVNVFGDVSLNDGLTVNGTSVFNGSVTLPGYYTSTVVDTSINNAVASQKSYTDAQIALLINNSDANTLNSINELL